MEIESNLRKWFLFLTFALSLFLIGVKGNSMIRSIIDGKPVELFSYAVVFSLGLSSLAIGIQLYSRKKEG